MELAEPHTSKTRRQPLPAERDAIVVLLRALLSNVRKAALPGSLGEGVLKDNLGFAFVSWAVYRDISM